VLRVYCLKTVSIDKNSLHDYVYIPKKKKLIT
jgi:hypothetical protein